jgi:iron complex outermembrane receptor protein
MMRLWCLTLAAVAVMINMPAYAGQSDIPDDDAADTFALDVDLGGDELLLFADMPVVISASRQARPINVSSVPVSVITADDIHYSGITSIADLLRQVPGMDVSSIDRNTVAFGVRGLHHQASDRTLLLIDGRDGGYGVQGGADFGRLPLFVEDIERIEVVRGPGGAAWGANAFNGVINILTKAPENTLGLFATSTLNEFGDTYSHLRWGHKIDEWIWRISAGYEGYESSDKAIDHDQFFSNDHARTTRFDGQAVYQPQGNSKLSFGLGVADVTRGDLEFFGFPMLPTDPRDNEDILALRMFARLDRDLTDGNSMYLQWSGNYEDADRPSFYDVEHVQNDIESQFNLKLGDKHEVSVGGNVRWTHLKSTRRNINDMLPTNSEDEFWLGAFVIDRWTVTQRLTVETQARIDWYSQSQIDWSGRLTGLYALDADQRHIARLSVGKAFRAPMYQIHEAAGSRIMIAPGVFAFTLLPADDIKNEQIWSFEAGYDGRLTEHLSLRLNGYYQIYSDLIGGAILPPSIPDTSLVQLRNIDGATAYGVEAELAWSRDNLTLAAWYAYNGFDDDIVDQNMRAFRPAPHKVGLSGRVVIADDFVANATYRYTDHTPNDPSGKLTSPGPDPYHGLDVTFSYKHERGEIMVGVLDVFDDTDEVAQQAGAFTAHETPGRTLFARVQVQF